MAAITLRDIEPGDVGWLVDQHSQLYARDEGFDETFGPLVADILDDFMRRRDAPRERGFIAVRGTQRLGSVFCVHADDRTAKLRLFLLLPEARGRGLGRHMLEACMAHARAQGYVRMVLWTHASHRAACALYEKAGWRCVSSKPVVSFGVALEELGWEVDL